MLLGPLHGKYELSVRIQSISSQHPIWESRDSTLPPPHHEVKRSHIDRSRVNK